MGLQAYLILAATVFCIGLFGVVTRRNTIGILLGIELMLNAVNINLIAFSHFNGSTTGMWAPDSYEAASTPFVAWLSVAPKTAGFVAIIRVYLEGLGSTAEIWMPILATLAGMTIVTGNLMAIPQKNIKRLLAYSGVAHIGYM